MMTIAQMTFIPDSAKPGSEHKRLEKKTPFGEVIAWLWKVFTHVASIYANLLEKNERIYTRKEANSLELSQDWFTGAPTWSSFHCFGTPTWPL